MAKIENQIKNDRKGLNYFYNQALELCDHIFNYKKKASKVIVEEFNKYYVALDDVLEDPEDRLDIFNVKKSINYFFNEKIDRPYQSATVAGIMLSGFGTCIFALSLYGFVTTNNEAWAGGFAGAFLLFSLMGGIKLDKISYEENFKISYDRNKEEIKEIRDAQDRDTCNLRTTHVIKEDVKRIGY